MLKKINGIAFKVILLTTVIIIGCKAGNIFAATKATGISAFPSSYQVYLKQLKRRHPNWTFTALNTGLKWQTVVENEGPYLKLDRSAIQLSFSEVWKWRNSSGNYNVIETGWVTASEIAVGYTMDPRKYLNEMQIFQFETLNYDSSTQNQEGVEKIFYGTLMYKNNIYYTGTNGNKQSINKTYSQVVMEAAAKYGVSPYHLASRIKQETGCDINNNTSIKGTVSGYVGLYNYYNIGATGGDNPALTGLAYARMQGWTNPELAINGGAKYIAEKYINVGQYTTYLQKFNVNDDSSYALYTHQYMQNILAPSKEAISTYNAYLKMNLLDIPFNFVIPVYDNMPETPVDIYPLNSNDFTEDSSKVYCTSNLNLRAGPSTSESVILTAQKGTIMTRIARGIQAGERWDKVRLETGLEGYVFQNYIKEYEYVKVENITLNVNNLEIGINESYNLEAEIYPNNSKYKELWWTSSDESIVTVTDTGMVTGLKEGVAVISVTTEDGHKTANAIITVRKKEPTITLDKDIYNVLVNNSSSFEVTISDSDILEYDAKIDDKSIAKIEGDKIIGISEGTAKITVNIRGTDIYKEASINVIELENGEVLIDESLEVDGDLIVNIEEGVRAQDIKDKFKTIYNIKLRDINGNEISDESLIGTGDKVQILREEKELVYEYNIVINGEVTGDGKINSGDLLRIVKHLNNTTVFNNPVILKAADVTKDNKINSGDLLKIVKYLNKTTTLR